MDWISIDCMTRVFRTRGNLPVPLKKVPEKCENAKLFLPSEYLEFYAFTNLVNINHSSPNFSVSYLILSDNRMKQ